MENLRNMEAEFRAEHGLPNRSASPFGYPDAANRHAPFGGGHRDPSGVRTPDSDAGRPPSKEDLLMGSVLRALQQIAKPNLAAPLFSGDAKQNPSAHLLRAEDRLNQTGVAKTQWSAEFRHTLDGKARIWYDGLTVPRAWAVMKETFTSQYSHLGRNSKQLWEKWKALTFTPDVDDIDVFIYDVKETCKQLSMGDDAALSRIKAEMPVEVYRTLYTVRTMKEAEAFLTEQFGKPHDFKALNKGPKDTLSSIQVDAVGSHKSNQRSPLSDGLSKSELLNAIRQQVQSGIKDLKDDWSTRSESSSSSGGSMSDYSSDKPPPRSPFKPWGMNTPRKRTPGRFGNRPQNRRFQGGSFNGNGQRLRPRELFPGGSPRNFQRPFQRPFQRRQFQRPYQRQNPQNSFRRNLFGENYGGRSPPIGGFDRSPTNKHPKVASKTVDKDRFRCRYCHNLGHWVRECPEKKRLQGVDPMDKNMTMDDLLQLTQLTLNGEDLTFGEAFDALN